MISKQQTFWDYRILLIFVLCGYFGYFLCWMLGLNGIPKFTLFQSFNAVFLALVGFVFSFLISKYNKFTVVILLPLFSFTIAFFADMFGGVNSTRDFDLTISGAIKTGFKVGIVHGCACLGCILAQAKIKVFQN